MSIDTHSASLLRSRDFRAQVRVAFPLRFPIYFLRQLRVVAFASRHIGADQLPSFAPISASNNIDPVIPNRLNYLPLMRSTLGAGRGQKPRQSTFQRLKAASDEKVPVTVNWEHPEK